MMSLLDHRWVFVGLAGATSLLLTLGLSLLYLSVRNPVRRRLGALGPAPVEKRSFPDRIVEWMHAAAEYVLPSQGAERERVESQLTQAGFRSPNTLVLFYGLKLCLILLLLCVTTGVMLLIPQVTGATVFYCAAVAGFVGLIAPGAVLRHLVDRRHQQLRAGFADALDMLVICVESGLGLMAAIQRVAEELQFSHPVLSDELVLVNVEMRAGVEREAALRNLVERVGLDDVRGLVSLLIQTLRFGTGVADTLRIYSEEFRDKRMQRAEERAAKVGTKLIFPLVFCLFPSFFVIAIGPAVIRIIAVLEQLSTSITK